MTFLDRLQIDRLENSKLRNIQLTKDFKLSEFIRSSDPLPSATVRYHFRKYSKPG